MDSPLKYLQQAMTPSRGSTECSATMQSEPANFMPVIPLPVTQVHPMAEQVFTTIPMEALHSPQLPQDEHTETQLQATSPTQATIGSPPPLVTDEDKEIREPINISNTTTLPQEINRGVDISFPDLLKGDEVDEIAMAQSA